MLPPEAIKEYQIIYEKYFNEAISEDQAIAQGTRLINLMKILLYESEKILENGHKQK